MTNEYDINNNQHVKDLRLAIEYKYLMQVAPPGVYLVPEFDNVRALHGVIFVRRGLYREGVFRFRIDLPPAYNDSNTHPLITFTPPIFNPLVDLSTGRLDLTVDDALSEWHPERHFLVTALILIKKIFYARTFDIYHHIPNSEAKRLFDDDKDEFLKRVDATVQESLKRLYDSQGPSNPLVFTEPQPGHEELIKDIFYTRRTDLVSSHAAQDEAETEKSRLEKSLLEASFTSSLPANITSEMSTLDVDVSMMSMDSIDLNRR